MCPFKLQDKPFADGERWVLRKICGAHNHGLSNTLVGHPYVDKLKVNEPSMVIDMT